MVGMQPAIRSSFVLMFLLAIVLIPWSRSSWADVATLRDGETTRQVECVVLDQQPNGDMLILRVSDRRSEWISAKEIVAIERHPKEQNEALLDQLRIRQSRAALQHVGQPLWIYAATAFLGALTLWGGLLDSVFTVHAQLTGGTHSDLDSLPRRTWVLVPGVIALMLSVHYGVFVFQEAAGLEEYDWARSLGVSLRAALSNLLVMGVIGIFFCGLGMRIGFLLRRHAHVGGLLGLLIWIPTWFVRYTG